jgi:hypothetical protein
VPLLRAEVKSVCLGDAAFQATDVRTLFQASRITLNHRTAFILQSSHSCLTGADNDWFWVYLGVRKVYRKILNGGSINLDVLRTATYGLRDIETNLATAAVGVRKVYKFNGSVYKARVCSWAKLVGRNPKFRRVPCNR